MLYENAYKREVNKRLAPFIDKPITEGVIYNIETEVNRILKEFSEDGLKVVDDYGNVVSSVTIEPIIYQGKIDGCRITTSSNFQYII